MIKVGTITIKEKVKSKGPKVERLLTTKEVRKYEDEFAGRLFVLCHPTDASGVADMQKMALHCIVRSKGQGYGGWALKETDEDPTLDMVMVDEAHHVFGDERLKAIVEEYLPKPKPEGTKTLQVLLLSDVSQSAQIGDAAFPSDMAVVKLNEVVRSTKRTISGAMAFLQGDMEDRGLVQCHHNSVGPPLKTFMFRSNSQLAKDDPGHMQLYVEHTAKALASLRQQLPGVSMHGRLAVLVPDAVFGKQLQDGLKKHGAFKGVKMVSAVTQTQSMSIGENTRSVGVRASMVGMRDASAKAKAAVEEEVIIDTIDNVDGLERLIVIMVGELD